MGGTIRRFGSDRSGNFAIMFSLAMVPLVFGVGMMLDVSTITRIRQELQHALDAAALAVAREGKDVSDGRAQDIAERVLQSNFGAGFTQLKVERQGTRFEVTAKTTAEMAFGGLFGYPNWPVDGAAAADLAFASYEIALVLDTTGSMAGGKLASMKDAVLGLIDSMSAQVKDADKLKFAMVPFSTFVNVGPGFGPQFDSKGKQIKGTGASWLDLDGRSPAPQVELPVGLSRFQLFRHLDQTWPGCVETRVAVGGKAYDTDDVAPDPSKPETLFMPAFAIDEGDGREYSNSYISSPVDPLDSTPVGLVKKLLKYGIPVNVLNLPIAYGTWLPVKIDTGTSSNMGYRKGPGYACVQQPISPLNSDYKAMKRKVGELKAQGNTNIMEGVAWGMRVLSPGAPFTEGKAKTTGIEKIMVVLTDGANTFGNTRNSLGSTYSSFGYLVDGRLGITSGSDGQTNDRMNAKTLAACSSAKAQGVEVYTIRLEEPDVATGTMLKDCASSPENYFDVPTRSQLDAAFKKIQERIVRLRIAS